MEPVAFVEPCLFLDGFLHFVECFFLVHFVLEAGLLDEVDGGFALVETGEVQDIEAAEYQFEPG